MLSNPSQTLFAVGNYLVLFTALESKISRTMYGGKMLSAVAVRALKFARDGQFNRVLSLTRLWMRMERWAMDNLMRCLRINGRD